ncbi:MAG: Crp/Fnr family transcriptional regulator [Bacteroidota bacterium]
MTLEKKRDFFATVAKYIQNDISKEPLAYFIEGLTEKSLAKNKIYIGTRKKHNEIGFIAKGLIRGFYIDDKGNEINTRFLKEGNFATHYKAFILEERSKYFFKSVEPTELLCFDYTHLKECYRLYPSFEKFGRLMAEAIIIKMDSRLESQHFDNAEKRYNDFMQEYPDLHNRLSLEQISSYIRITRPALSRLRARKS